MEASELFKQRLSSLSQHQTGWDWCALEAVCEGIFDCPHSTPQMSTSGPLIARSQDIRTRVFRTDQAAHVSEDTYIKRVRRAEPRYGDILYSREGTYFGIAAEVPLGVQVCLGQRMVLIRPRRTIAAKYLYYWLNSPILASFVYGQRDGSVAERLNLPTIRRIPVLLPTLKEQESIAHVLGALDDKIELNRRMSQTLEEMARTVFKSWFVHFETPRHVLTEALDTWKISSIYEIATVRYGAPFSSALFNEEGSGHPLIRIRDLLTQAPTIYTTEQPPGGKLVSSGDILVGMDGEFRARVWLGSPAWLNQRVCMFEPKPGISRMFLLLSIEGPLAFFEGSKTGTTVIHLGKADIDTFRMLVPGSKIMQAFADLTDPMLSAMVSNEHESRMLVALRDALLPKLLSGEIRIKQAETIVGEAL